MTTRTFYILLLFVSGAFGCKKDTVTNSSPTNYTCSTIGMPQDTVVSNGIKYYIVATSDLDNTVTIKLNIGPSMPSSGFVTGFLQIHTPSSCHETHRTILKTTSHTETESGHTFTFVYDPFPKNVIDTNTVSILNMKIDNVVFYLRDSKIDN